jgi:AraC family transcriptional regulator of adaptative response / DNA-3-methyladenine glycosylase II
MDLDREACYRAFKARDRRFDGRFFIGVSSTGIFCRPICPARTPRFENCIFFPTAAAAYSAGFRPCLRCRPEINPGVPAWNGTAATVNRALRLIAEEGPEAANLLALASRLGVGSRHLRRLFRRHVGASPVAVLQAQRVFLAKQLITDSSLPLSQVALGAGFGSVRRFNTVMRRTFGRAPRDLRRAAGSTASRLTLRLPYRPPYDRAGVHLGAILGVVQAGGGLGGAIGPYLGGWLFDVTGSYRLAFAVAAVATAGAAVAAWLAARPNAHVPAPTTRGAMIAP